MGCIYKRGRVWWIQYYRNGKAYAESSLSQKKMVARKLLDYREGEIAQGKMPGYHFHRVKFEDLLEDFRIDYAHKGQKRPRTAHLEAFFEGMGVTELTTARVKEYTTKRLEGGAANATINRELATLKRMFNLGKKETPPKVGHVPYIPMLDEDNVKRGFLTDEDYHALLEKLPPYLKGPVQFAYLTGWRREQIGGITWGTVNLSQRLIVVPGEMTKNSKSHTIYLNDPFLELLSHQSRNRLTGKHLDCPYVFHRDGQRIKDFRTVWNRACGDAGLGCGYRLDTKYAARWEKKGLKAGPTFHDCRRTAVRNFNRDGTPENIAMKITGHKTNSTYKRYGIVTVEDLKWAAE
jgi:integrase